MQLKTNDFGFSFDLKNFGAFSLKETFGVLVLYYMHRLNNLK